MLTAHWEFLLEGEKVPLKWVTTETQNEEMMACQKLLHFARAYSPLGVHFRECKNGIKMVD